MDETLRQLERTALSSNDPVLMESWDAAQERAGLPFSLAYLKNKEDGFRSYITRNLLSSLIHSLNLYMDRYQSIVEHLAWDYSSGYDISWELGNTNWTNSICILYTKTITDKLWEETDISMTGRNDVSIDEENLEPLPRADYPLVYQAYEDAEKLLELLRNFQEDLAMQFVEYDYVVFTKDKQLLYLSDEALADRCQAILGPLPD